MAICQQSYTKNMSRHMHVPANERAFSIGLFLHERNTITSRLIWDPVSFSAGKSAETCVTVIRKQTRMMHRLRKQSRLFCGHCDEYLSRTAFWKHRKLYYDLHNECWTRKDDAEEFKEEMETALHSASPAGFTGTAENTNPLFLILLVRTILKTL